MVKSHSNKRELVMLDKETKELLVGKKVVKHMVLSLEVFLIPYLIKKKILALKTLLSARLAEGKLRIVDNEKIEVGKTKIVKNILD